MFYKYIYFKLFIWWHRGLWGDTYYPQSGATYLLTLLILSNAYLILFLLELFNIYNSPAKILIAVFFSMYLFNHLYFFWINKWKGIVSYLNNNNVSSKIKFLSNTYIIFSITSSLIAYLFNVFIRK